MELSNSNESCIITKYNYYQENISIIDDEKSVEESNIESLSLSNDIEKLSHRLEKISISELSFIKNLEEWRIESHEIIDKFCQSKHDEYIERTNKDIYRIKEEINLLNIDHDDAAQDYIDWIKQTILLINQQINQLQQIQNKFLPLNIDKSIIYFPPEISHIKPLPSPLKDLFHFSSSNELFSPLSSISSFNFTNINFKNNNFDYVKEKLNVPIDHWYSLCKNDTNILITGKTDLILIDQSFKIINKKSFSSIEIKDISWSKILSRFILITSRKIYLFDEKNLSLEETSISLGNHNPWECGTVSEANLFLSTFGEYPIIVHFNLLPSIHLNRKYNSSFLCQEYDIINDIKSNDIHLGLIIDNGFNNQTRLEIRLIKSFDIIWFVSLGKGWGYRCSPLNSNHWIISDSYNQRILFIDNQGNIQNIQNYFTKPFNIINWNDNQIIIRTNQTLNIHQY